MVQEIEEELLASQVTATQVCSPTRPCPAWVPAPAQPQPEDEDAGDCHQPRLPLRGVLLRLGLFTAILIRGLGVF